MMRMERDRPAVMYKDPTPMDVYYCLHGQWIPSSGEDDDGIADTEAEAQEIMEDVTNLSGDFGEQLQGMQEFYQRAYGTKIEAFEEKIECLNLEIEELNQYARHQKACEELLQQQLENADEEIRKYQGEDESIKQLDLSQVIELEKAVRVSLGKLEAKKMELIEANLSVVNQQRLCTICMEDDRTVLLMPCRHLCLCTKCADQSSLQLCPICRNHIQDKVIVFI